MANALKYLDLQEKTFSLGSQVAAYVKKEVVPNTFEEPAAADLILVTADVKPSQVRDKVASTARISGSREPQAQVAGTRDHGATPFEFEWRPPRQMTGSDKAMGSAVMQALFGTERTVDTQTKRNIDAINSYTLKAIEVDFAGTAANYKVGDPVKLVSNNTASKPANNEPAFVTAVTDLGGGNIRLKLEPGFTVRPIITGTKDQIQGGVGWSPDAEWKDRFSLYLIDGFDNAALSGGVFPKGTFEFDRRSLFHIKAMLDFRKSVLGGTDQVRGAAGADTFLSTDTVLDVGDASKFEAGALVDLVKVVVATDVKSTESKAKVTAVNRTANPNTVTLQRGTTPVSSTDLTVVTSATQERNGPYNLSTTKILRLSVDNRGDVDIDLTKPTAPAIPTAATAAEVVANINDTLAGKEPSVDASAYGLFGGALTGTAITWAAGVAVVSGTAVRLNSKVFGSQSRLQTKDTGLSSSAHAIVFQATFDISATDEVQIKPWDPGGTETKTPVHAVDGWSKVEGNLMPTSGLTVEFDNAGEWLENVRHKDQYPFGVIPAIKKLIGATVQVPALGWTSRLDIMAREDDKVQFLFFVGVADGSVLAIFAQTSRLAVPEKSGDNQRVRGFRILPEQNGTILAMYAGLV